MTPPDNTVPTQKLEEEETGKAGDQGDDAMGALEMLDWFRKGGWMVAVHNDYRQHGRVNTFWLLTHSDGRWVKGEGVSDALALYSAMQTVTRRAPEQQVSEAIAWACVQCNSPRSINPCPKCGTPLTKPADGWDWPTLPDVDRIRALAREVGYAVGVHGSLERDLDLIAAPWVESAVSPAELAQHIADGLGGQVVDSEIQDKPCGRWSCNIHTPDWTKMIDLSVMPPHVHDAHKDKGTPIDLDE